MPIEVTERPILELMHQTGAIRVGDWVQLDLKTVGDVSIDEDEHGRWVQVVRVEETRRNYHCPATGREFNWIFDVDQISGWRPGEQSANL